MLWSILRVFPSRERGTKIRFCAIKSRLEQHLLQHTYPLALVSGGCQVHRSFSQEYGLIVRMLIVGMLVCRIHRSGLLLLHFLRLAAVNNLLQMQQSHWNCKMNQKTTININAINSIYWFQLIRFKNNQIKWIIKWIQ